MRLLWQSFTRPGTDYLATLQRTLQSLVSPGTRVDVDGLDPADGFVHRLSELRCANQVIAQNADAAERGYDAVVIGHFQDGGLPELRSILDIPVVGLGEAAIHHALQLGDRFGLVTINRGFLAFHRRQVREYQQEAKFAGVRAMNTDAATYHSAFDGDTTQVERVAADFASAAAELVEAGADVVIPAGGFPALLLWNFGKVPDLDGASVLDPMGLAIGQAELWARLGRSRVTPGRAGGFARPEPAAVDEFVASVRAPSEAWPRPATSTDTSRATTRGAART